MMGHGEPLLTLHADYAGGSMLGNAQKASDYTLEGVYAGEKYGGKAEVSYEYDMGDGWYHQITFLGRADANLRKVMGIPDDMPVFCFGGEVSLPIFAVLLSKICYWKHLSSHLR